MSALPQEIQPQTVQLPATTPAIIVFNSTLREQGYGAFKLSDYDIVAARSKEEAFRWFVENWECHPEELYREPIEIILDDTLNYVDSPDSMIREVSYRELIRNAIQDTLEFPCIVATFEW